MSTMTIYQEAISVDSPQLLVVHGLSRELYRWYMGPFGVSDADCQRATFSLL